jgi:hypothetical protein
VTRIGKMHSMNGWAVATDEQLDVAGQIIQHVAKSVNSNGSDLHTSIQLFTRTTIAN